VPGSAGLLAQAEKKDYFEVILEERRKKD